MNARRRVLVTGAGGGIGAVVCRRLLARGDVEVVASDRTPELLAATAAACGSSDLLVCRTADVTDTASVDALAGDASASGALDGLVNLAGTEGRAFAPLHALDRDELRHVLDVNLIAMFDVCRALLPALLEDGGGAVVNVASVAGAVAFRHQSPYVISKHGVVGLTRSLALDYADCGLRANCVSPGLVAGPMMARVEQSIGAGTAARLRNAVPTGRYCTPEEVADTIVWLVLEAPASLTGADITVDGGWTVK